MAVLQGSTQWALHSSCRVFSCQGCSPGPWHRGHPHRTAGSRGTAIVIMIHLQHSIVFFNPVRATAVHLLPPSHEQPQPDPGLPLSSWEASQPLWSELWDLQAGLLALVFPHRCFRKNPNLTGDQMATWTESGSHSPLCKQSQPSKWHQEPRAPRALLTANSCWHLVCARLGALHKASQCRQWLKASAAEERFLQTNSFLLWDYFFFLSKHQNYLICKYMYESPEESLNLSLNYWKFIIIFSWKKSRISSNPTCSHLLKLNASWPREKLRKPLK